MAMIKVLYVDQTSGLVEDSLLDDLIAKGKIAAFCIADGWVNVTSERVSGIAVEQENTKERGREHEAAGNKGNCQAKRINSGENE
jgi:hypothetical protein